VMWPDIPFQMIAPHASNASSSSMSSNLDAQSTLPATGGLHYRSRRAR
jgi:hypothetical protein